MDILKAIYLDTQEYERLCQKYNEKPKTKMDGRIDPYGQHAKTLKERESNETT